ncbi:MAG TPA: sulfotransferase family protein, partial [Rhodanobacteraceae bacterium]
MSPIRDEVPPNSALAPRVRALLNEAGQHLARNRVAAAGQVLTAALALAPADPAVLRMHATYLNRIGRHAEARAILQPLLEKGL